MSTTEESKTEGKKAGDDAPPVSIGWDSHKPVVRRLGFASAKINCILEFPVHSLTITWFRHLSWLG